MLPALRALLEPKRYVGLSCSGRRSYVTLEGIDSNARGVTMKIQRRGFRAFYSQRTRPQLPTPSRHKFFPPTLRDTRVVGIRACEFCLLCGVLELQSRLDAFHQRATLMRARNERSLASAPGHLGHTATLDNNSCGITFFDTNHETYQYARPHLSHTRS